MNDLYVKKYANGIANNEYNLAEGLFHAEYIMKQYEWEIWAFLEKIGVVHSPDDPEKYRLDGIEWDYYDCSLELKDCVDDFTMTTEQVRAIKEDLGFSIIFVNYKNGPHLYGNHTAAMDAMPKIKE